MSGMGNETQETFEIRGKRVDIVACWDGETPEGEVDFYELYLRGEDGEQDTHLNLGDPWYPDEGEGKPTIEEVTDYVVEHFPDLFPEPERHYRLVTLVTVTDEVKEGNDRGDMDDEEYVGAEMGWAESSFAGAEQVSLTKVPMPSGDLLHMCPLEILHAVEHGHDGGAGTGWSDYSKTRIMQDYIRNVDPEGFVMYVLGIAAEERKK